MQYGGVLFVVRDCVRTICTGLREAYLVRFPLLMGKILVMIAVLFELLGQGQGLVLAAFLLQLRSKRLVLLLLLLG